MGNNVGKEVKHACGNDCRGYEGCPDHIARVEFSRSSNFVMIFVEDAIPKLASEYKNETSYYCFPEATWEAILESWESIK